MNEYLENQLNKSVVYQQLKDNCERNNQHEVLALAAKVGAFAVERLKTVIKNMPEFTLHDDTHIFNMLTIIGKLIPQENMRKLSTPDLFMLIVSVGYYMHYDPCTILCMQPTLSLAETMSKDRLMPMVRDTPALRDKINEKSRTAGNTIFKKAFPGGRITMSGANSPTELRSRPTYN